MANDLAPHYFGMAFNGVSLGEDTNDKPQATRIKE